MNQVKWSVKATRQLIKLEKKDQRVIYKGVDTLKEFPDCKNIKKLKNHKYQYRLRIGNYRVFFEFDGIVKILIIEEVKKRDEHTY